MVRARIAYVNFRGEVRVRWGQIFLRTRTYSAPPREPCHHRVSCTSRLYNSGRWTSDFIPRAIALGIQIASPPLPRYITYTCKHNLVLRHALDPAFRIPQRINCILQADQVTKPYFFRARVWRARLLNRQSLSPQPWLMYHAPTVSERRYEILTY